ncbi:hypothetical protein ACWDE9_41255, partial [Streptomyces olivaceoviridis]
ARVPARRRTRPALRLPGGRLARYGAAGRARVLSHYTWDRVADGVAAVYGAVSSIRSLSGVVR